MAPSANGQTVGRRLPVESAFTRVEDARHRLPRLFGRRDLVVLGLGVMIGSGIFSLSGKQAATAAGPAVILSFLIAALVCVLAAAVLRRTVLHDPGVRQRVHLQLCHLR